MFLRYEDFICCLQRMVQQEMGKEVRVSLHRVSKNNGIYLDGLSIQEGDQGIAPTIYLNDFYREFQEGSGLPQIAEQVSELYEKSKIKGKIDTSFYMNFENIREHVACKLISFERNRELLEKVPYVRYLDLAVVFYYLMEHEELGEGTILIYGSHLEMWKVTEEELYRQARENTLRLLSWEFYSMREVIQGLAGEESDEELLSESGLPMYVLTNRSRSLGAAVILFDRVLTEVGERLGEDFYILPSSVHEVIIIPSGFALPKEELEHMVREINETQVLPQEILSDRVYYYCCTQHSLG